MLDPTGRPGFLALLAVGLIGMTYYLFFSGKYKYADRGATKIVYFLMTASVLSTIYILTRRLIKDQPVLSFDKSGLTVNQRGADISLLWVQIIDWGIEQDKDGGTYYLTIETSEKKRKISISWLEKSPAEIEDLLREYTQ